MIVPCLTRADFAARATMKTIWPVAPDAVGITATNAAALACATDAARRKNRPKNRMPPFRRPTVPLLEDSPHSHQGGHREGLVYAGKSIL